MGINTSGWIPPLPRWAFDILRLPSDHNISLLSMEWGRYVCVMWSVLINRHWTSSFIVSII